MLRPSPCFYTAEGAITPTDFILTVDLSLTYKNLGRARRQDQLLLDRYPPALKGRNHSIARLLWRVSACGAWVIFSCDHLQPQRASRYDRERGSSCLSTLSVRLPSEPEKGLRFRYNRCYIRPGRSLDKEAHLSTQHENIPTRAYKSKVRHKT